ncbi:MAG: ATP-binding protein [Nitrospiraceae bacterium]|nr:ATP-binding protein [Nitrospiraceae bacterium]
MRSLFLKIFLWFWLAMALSGATLVIMTHAVQIGPIARQHRRIEHEWDRVLRQTLSVYGQAAIESYGQGGLPALRRFTGRLDKSTGVRLSLFEDGNLLSGGAERGAYGAGPSPDIRKLVAMVLNGKSGNASLIEGKGYLLVLRLGGPGRHVYEVAGRWPQTPFRFGPPGSFGFHLLVSFIIGGIVSYGLAWRLTAPVGRLREATHQLAAGNLKARAGAELGARNDEIGALARDFDGMAGRIESLVAAQQRLIRDISHELRSPLARLRVALELARQKNLPDEAAGPLDRIEREAERLNDLIAELVTLTLLESGAERLERSVVDLPALVREVAADADFEARGGMKRALKVLVNGEGPIGSIRGSEEMLRRAVENVVRNALRYTPEGGQVEIALERTRKDGRPHFIISVRDHGPGVPEGALKEIFRPFYRVTDARERLTGGAGIGLAITERAVHLHGGQVTARNADGGGLLVEIDLPEDS